jgi:hypothetical protein
MIIFFSLFRVPFCKIDISTLDSLMSGRATADTTDDLPAESYDRGQRDIYYETSRHGYMKYVDVLFTLYFRAVFSLSRGDCGVESVQHVCICGYN